MPDGQGKNIMTLQLGWAGHNKPIQECLIHPDPFIYLYPVV